jgi:hypothetical protein
LMTRPPAVSIATAVSIAKASVFFIVILSFLSECGRPYRSTALRICQPAGKSHGMRVILAESSERRESLVPVLLLGGREGTAWAAVPVSALLTARDGDGLSVHYHRSHS